MNPSQREGGWPPASGGNQNGANAEAQGQQGRPLGSHSEGNPSHQPPQQAQHQPAPPVLPPPSGSFFSGQQGGPSLPHIAGLTQGPQSSPPRPPQALPSMQTRPNEADLPRQQAEVGDLNRGQHLHEQGDIDGQRLNDSRMREGERQSRDVHDSARLDGPHSQTQQPQASEHSGGPAFYQPVAVAPQRSVLGPNGILGGGAPPPVNGPLSLNPQLGAPSGPGNAFAGSAHTGQPQDSQGARSQPAPPVQPPAMGTGSYGPAAGQAAMVGQGQQPILNDALSYLDQVKVQFSDRPDVYNKFLDIMKDFKSAQIDTPGVIDRVSNLFAGNPQLIQGFNTFLPPGYKIECGAEDDPNAIRVTTPMGTTNLQLPSRPLSNPRPIASSIGANGQQQQPIGYQLNQHRANEPSWLIRSEQSEVAGIDRRDPSQYGSLQQGSSGPLSPELARQQQLSTANAALMHQQEQRGVSQLQNAASAAGSVAGMQQAGNLEKTRGPVEFNHAISYVNKIKNRFASQPDIYKQFLEILQTYQRESKPIQEVYGQVTTLFQTAPDLLEDFKQFLPESAAHAKALAQSREEQAMLSNLRGEAGYMQTMHSQQMHTPRPDQSRMPPLGNFAPTPNASRENKRKRGERAPANQGAAGMGLQRGVETVDQNGRAAYGQGGAAGKRSKHAQATKTATAVDIPPVSPTLVPTLPAPLPPTTSVAPTPDELSFFDRVRKHLGSKSMMNELLKLCEMYSGQLIDKRTLVHRMHTYIGGNPELMSWFKVWCGYRDEDEIIENRPRQPSGRVALTSCRSYGPSYRLLPKREQLAVCSGRDELCKSVLNDEWASHPTWASEDSGFVAHRKNVHEEGLHRIEEERHDYDFNIETAARLIQLLEPIAQSLLHMSAEERVAYQLPRELGGASEAIPKRVIMKIYGRERGDAVHKRLFEAPYQCVPILLNRVKTSIEEWKAAQREWEKVWRKQTQVLFWKSLDHQSQGAKNADKRQFQTKTLQNEISVKYQEQREKRARGIPTESYQFSFKVHQNNVLMDAAALVINHIQSLSTSSETAQVEDFFKDFLATFFGFDRQVVEQQLDIPYQSPEDSDEAGDATPATDTGGQKVNGRAANLRQALHKGSRLGQLMQADAELSVASGSRATTPGASSAVDGDTGDRMDVVEEDDANPDAHLEKWLEHPPGGNVLRDQPIEPNEAFTRSEYHMYCNLPIYCFVRMFLILYERLYNLYAWEDEVAADVRRAMEAKPATKLQMIDKYPTDFFDDVGPSANYYQQVLDRIHEVVRTEADTAQLEEILRRYYLHSGWMLYSVDKLLQSLTRFATAIKNGESKDKTWDIWMNFRKDRVREETTFADELAYRKKVEKDIKEGEMYRITYESSSRKVYIRLFHRDDPTFNLSELDEIQLWATYVNSYTSIPHTEGVPAERIHMPFLRRQVPAPEDQDEAVDRVDASEKLSARISPDTYKPSFTPDQADWVVHTHPTLATAELEKEAMASIKEEASHSDDRVAEKLVMNSPWMKEMSAADVEAAKTKYAEQKEGSTESAALLA